MCWLNIIQTPCVLLKSNYPLVMQHSHGKSFLIGKPSISMGHLYDGYVKSPEGTMFSTIDDDHLRSNGSGATRSAAQADHANIASLTVEDGLPTTDHWAPPELRVGNIASLHRFESF